MHFISAKPLIEKFRNGTFEETEVGPYFMINMIVLALILIPVANERDLWMTASGIASVVITICGVLYLKKKNGNSYGNHFLSKYYMLGWVTCIRMILLTVPIAFGLCFLGKMIGANEVLCIFGAIFVILLELAYYWWLGRLFEKSNAPH